MTTKYVIAMDVAWRHIGFVIFDIDNDQPAGFGNIITKKVDRKRGVRAADVIADEAASIVRRLKELIEKTHVCAIVAEIPNGGAKSSKAMKLMAAATVTVASVAELLDLPAEWTTPDMGKISFCNNTTASKEEMMEACRTRFPSIKWPKIKVDFEHVADAAAAYTAAKNGRMIRTLKMSMR